MMFKKLIQAALLLVGSTGMAFADYAYDDNKSVVVYGDALYLRLQQAGIDNCGSSVPDHKWGWGYRVGLEYGFECSSLDLAAEWTHIDISAGSKGGIDEVHGHLQFDYDTIDLTSGFDYAFSPGTAVRPFLGLRYGQFSQKENAFYSYDQVCLTGTTVISNNIDERLKYRGLGPVFGVDGEFGFGCGFSLYGSVGTGFLYGHYTLDRDNDESFFAVGANNDTCFENDHCKKQSVNAFLDASLGIQWQTCLCDGFGLVFRLGVEHHQYFNFDRLGSDGDLSLDGAHASIGLEF